MNRRAFAALAAFGVALPLVRVSQADQPEQGEGLGADELVARVQACYERASTFKAGFRLITRYEMKGASGTVIFEKPSKMSWRYAHSGSRVVSDGRRIQVYERENKQLYEQPVEKSQFPSALFFLTVEGKLGQRFRFTKRDMELVKHEGQHLLIADPLQPSPAYQRLAFYVDARSYQVRRVLIIDAQGNRNRFDFINSELNVEVPPAEFSFTAPLGTQIIGL